MRDKSMRENMRFACAVLAWVLCCLSSGCVFEFEESEPRKHGSAGAEVFRVVCMRLAAQAFPQDLTGHKFESRCAGSEQSAFTEATPEGEPRVHALDRFNLLVQKRRILVPALDAALDSPLFARDELRTFLANLLPLYDAPELLPDVTQTTAALLQDLIDARDPAASAAIEAFSRMGAREGYRPLTLALGLAHPLLAYPELDTVVTTTLASIQPAEGERAAGAARSAWEELLRAGALDLATADATPPDPARPGTLAIARKLLLSEDPVFAGGRGPLYVTRRDHRGVAMPTLIAGAIGAPFSDRDADGFADLDENGRLRSTSGVQARALSPFPTLSAALLGRDQDQRDSAGRVLFGAPDAPQLLYQYIDADRTLLAGLTRDVGSLLVPKPSTPALTASAVHDFAYGLSALLGDFKQQSASFEAAKLSYIGPDTSTGPFFDFVHALGAVLPFEDTERFLQVLQILLRDHEQEIASLVEAILYIDERADTHPEAVWEQPHEFWDDLIAWLQRVLAREGMLEALLRAASTEQTEKAGALLGNFMRYRDRVSYPLGKQEELEALGIDIRQVLLPSALDPKKPRLLVNPCVGNNQAAGCGSACDLTKPCAGDLACVLEQPIPSSVGTCGSVAAAVQAHRSRVNAPCAALPTSLSQDPVADCTPEAPAPAAHHRGARNCPSPDMPPTEGSACTDIEGVGLCSFDAGSFVCDCDGGLCRGQQAKTWRLVSTKPTQGYAQWVDRAQPDSRVSSDGQTNQSLFQRTAALVHDLHVPAKLCNKEQAKLGLFDPAGSTTESGLTPLLTGPLGNIVLGALGAQGALDEKPACAVLEEPEIVRFFARSILGTAVLDLKDPALRNLLDQLETLTDNGLVTLLGGLIGLNSKALARNEVMQRQSQVRGLFIGGVNGLDQTVPSPRPSAIARMVFAPFNPFEAGLLDLPLTRDDKVIVDLHRDTIFAWEVRDPLGQANFYQTLAPLLEAFETHELYDDQGELVDGYLFGDLMTLVHRHWSSRSSDATVRMCDDGKSPPVCGEASPLFAYQSNGVAYEELAAEALVDAQLLTRLRSVLTVLDQLEVDDGEGGKIDGIAVLARVTRNLFDASASCGPMGCEAQPLTYRDGTRSAKTNTGKNVAQLAPIYLLLDALNAIDRRFEGEHEQRLAPWREARSQLVDLLLDVERPGPGEVRFKNPRARAFLLNVIGLLQDRLETYAHERADCIAAGGIPENCRKVHEWAFGLTPRLEESLGQPVSAALLRLLDQFWGMQADPGGRLFSLMRDLSKEQPGATAQENVAFDTTLLALTDALQLFENTDNVAPVMHFLAKGIAPNALDVIARGDSELQLEQGALEKSLQLLRELERVHAAPDGKQSTITQLLRALATPHGPHGESPLEIILEVISEVNRAQPGKADGTPLDAQDIRAVLGEASQFLSSERHGLERLYDIIQSRKLP
jgi:hypothetical protein